MPYIPPETIELARQMDLLTYLRIFEPDELVHIGGNHYCTREHLLLVTVIYWIAMLIYSFFTLGYLGFEGAGCVVQLRIWKSLYNITMWQAWVLALLCGYIGNLFLAALTMYISAKTKSAVIAVTTPFVIMFIPSFLQGMADWLDVVVNLMPVSLLEFYQHLGTFNLITVFGKVYRTVDLCIPLYILLTILLIPIMYREYKTKQVL